MIRHSGMELFELLTRFARKCTHARRPRCAAIVWTTDCSLCPRWVPAVAALPCLQLLVNKGGVQAALRLYAGDAKEAAKADAKAENKDKPELKARAPMKPFDRC